MKIDKYHKAFTLVELLIVIAIISILAGLLLPSLRRAVTTARIITCSSNLKQLFLLDGMYVEEYGYHTPRMHKDNSFAIKSCWYNEMAKFMNYGYNQTPNLPRSGDIGNSERFSRKNTQRTDTIFLCPDGMLGGNGENYFYQSISYGITSYSIEEYYTEEKYKGLRKNKVKRPSLRTFMYDTGNVDFFIPGAGQDPETYASISSHIYVSVGTSPAAEFIFNDFLNGRHRNIVNVLFYDGHIQSMQSLEVNKHRRYSSTFPEDENMFKITK